MLQRKKIIRRARAERITEICAAARLAFEAHGYEGAVMADIARAAGVAEGTVYKLFDSKRALLHSVMESWYGEFTAGLKQTLSAMDEPAQKIRYLISQHLYVIKNDPGLCRVFFREVRAYDDYRESAMFTLNQDYTSLSLNVLREGASAGDFRSDIPLAVIRDTIFGGIEHHVWQFLADKKPLDVDATTEHFYRLIIAGIKPVRAQPEAQLEQLAPLVNRLEAVAGRLEVGRAR